MKTTHQFIVGLSLTTFITERGNLVSDNPPKLAPTASLSLSFDRK